MENLGEVLFQGKEKGSERKKLRPRSSNVDEKKGEEGDSRGQYAERRVAFVAQCGGGRKGGTKKRWKKKKRSVYGGGLVEGEVLSEKRGRGEGFRKKERREKRRGTSNGPYFNDPKAMNVLEGRRDFKTQKGDSKRKRTRGQSPKSRKT